jgi:hypothetical protein
MAKPGTRKVMLYVRSVEVPSGAFVDREGALHACAQARQKAFAGLKGAAHLVGRVYPDADWQALCIAQSVQDGSKVEFEIVDLAKGLVRRLKLRRQGITKTPQFMVAGRLLPLIKSPEELLRHL